MNDKFSDTHSSQEGENTASPASRETDPNPPEYSPFQSFVPKVQEDLRAGIKTGFPDIPSERADAMIKGYRFPVRSNDPAEQAKLELAAALEMASDPIVAPSPQSSIVSADSTSAQSGFTESTPDDLTAQDSWEPETFPECLDQVISDMSAGSAPQSTTPAAPITGWPSQIVPAADAQAEVLPAEVIQDQSASARNTPVLNVTIENITIQTAPTENTPTQSLSTEKASTQLVPTKSTPAQLSPTGKAAEQAAKKAIALRLFEHIAQPYDFSVAPDEVNNEYDVLKTAASKLRFARFREQIHCYNRTHYKVLDNAAALGTILASCRDEIRSIGRFLVLKNAYEFLKVDPRFEAAEEWIDYGSDYVTFFNGNLNWRTGVFGPHTPSVFTTYALKANYMGPMFPSQSSRFIQFLYEAGGGSPEWVERALSIIGYCLVPDLSGRCAFLFQGKSAGGKSLISRFVSSFFPDENVAALSAHELTNDFAAAELENAAICVTPDMPATPLEEKAVGRIKAMSGRDLIQGNRKHINYKKFYFTGKFMMCTNHALLTAEPDPAFDSRIVALPFRYSTPPEKQDPDLLSKFNAERDYIANCAIAAYFRLRSNHYRFAGDFRMNMPDVLEGSSESISGMVLDFVVNNCVADPNGSIYVADALSLFHTFYGIDLDPATFGVYFKKAVSIFKGTKSSRKRLPDGKNPMRYYEGIALKPQGGETHEM